MRTLASGTPIGFEIANLAILADFSIIPNVPITARCPSKKDSATGVNIAQNRE